MKKILFVIDSLGCGGAEKSLINLINIIDTREYDVTVISLLKLNSFKTDVKNNIKIKYIFDIYNTNVFIRNSNKLLFRLLKFSCKLNLSFIINYFVVKDEYDISAAYLEGISTKIVSLIKTNSFKIACIHTNLIKNYWYKRVFKNTRDEKISYDKFNKVFCVSLGCKEAFIKKFHWDKNNIHVIYNPINYNEIIRKSQENINMNIKGIKICSVGKLIKVKGYYRLINVHKKLIDEGYEHTLILVGDGGEKTQLIKLVKKLKLEKSVKIYGYKENPYPYIKNSDIYVSASYTEGLPTVLIEAMILNKPIIATNCTGNDEILDYGTCGLLVENTENGLLGGLKDMILNKNSLRNYFRLKSNKKIKEFSNDNFKMKIKSLIKEY